MQLLFWKENLRSLHTIRYIITYTQKKNKPVFLCFEKKFKKKYYFVRLIDTIIIISYPRDERKKEKNNNII